MWRKMVMSMFSGMSKRELRNQRRLWSWDVAHRLSKVRDPFSFLYDSRADQAEIDHAKRMLDLIDVELNRKGGNDGEE